MAFSTDVEHVVTKSGKSAVLRKYPLAIPFAPAAGGGTITSQIRTPAHASSLFGRGSQENDIVPLDETIQNVSLTDAALPTRDGVKSGLEP